MKFEDAANLTKHGSFFKYWMPYLLQKVEVSGHKWAYLPLNRNYKPLGYLSHKRVVYSDYMNSHGVVFKKDPALFDGVWVLTDDEDGGRLWLYTDAMSSRGDYFARLSKLMTKSIKILGKREE